MFGTRGVTNDGLVGVTNDGLVDHLLEDSLSFPVCVSTLGVSGFH